MRNKVKVIAKLPKSTLWVSHGNFEPTYALEQQKRSGTEYQHVGFDTNGKCVFAGVSRHAENNQATANQIIRVWRKWRWEYDHVFGNPNVTYPAKQMYSTQAELRQLVTQLSIHPIGDPTQVMFYNV